MAINASVIWDFSPEKQNNYLKACGSTKDNSNNYIISDVKYIYKCLNFLRQWQSIMCTSIAPKIAYQSLNQLARCPDAGLCGVSAWLRYSHCTPALLSTRDTSPVANTHTRTKWFILCEHWADIAQFYNYYITQTLLGVIKSKSSQTGENQTPTKPNTRCAGLLHWVSLHVPYISNDTRFTRQTSKPLLESRGHVVRCFSTLLMSSNHASNHTSPGFLLITRHTLRSLVTDRNITTGLFKFKWASEAGCVCVCVGAFGACVSAHPCYAQ